MKKIGSTCAQETHLLSSVVHLVCVNHNLVFVSHWICGFLSKFHELEPFWMKMILSSVRVILHWLGVRWNGRVLSKTSDHGSNSNTNQWINDDGYSLTEISTKIFAKIPGFPVFIINPNLYQWSCLIIITSQSQQHLHPSFLDFRKRERKVFRLDCFLGLKGRKESEATHTRNKIRSKPRKVTESHWKCRKDTETSTWKQQHE